LNREALSYKRRRNPKHPQSYLHSLPAKEKHLAVESLGFIYPLKDRLKQVPGYDVAVANPKRIRQTSDSKQKHDRAEIYLSPSWGGCFHSLWCGGGVCTGAGTLI
jgi:hypothetical protein